MTSAAPDARPPAHAWEDLEAELCSETPDQWAVRCEAASENAFNRVLIVLARHATNDEMRALLRQLDTPDFRHRSRVRHWAQNMTTLAPTLTDSTSAYRRLHSQWDDHRFIHYTPHPSQGLLRSWPAACPTIIAFTGNAGLLLAPIACVLEALSNSGHDLLVIRRLHRERYLERDGQLLLSIVEHLRHTLRHRVRRSVTLGTSQGGLAALWTAHALRLRLGVAIGAGATAEILQPGGPLQRATQGLEVSRGARIGFSRRTRLLLAAPLDYRQDLESALLISRHFNNLPGGTARARAVLFPGCSRHNLLKDLATDGLPLNRVLPPLISQALRQLPPHLSSDGDRAPR